MHKYAVVGDIQDKKVGHLPLGKSGKFAKSVFFLKAEKKYILAGYM